MGKYYVPDEHGNYQEYESRADYERQQDEALNGCIHMFVSKIGFSVLTLLCAWWPVEEPGTPLWFSIILTALAFINFFLPNSSDSPFLRIVRGVIIIGTIILFCHLTLS